jgi:hypothetical protein
LQFAICSLQFSIPFVVILCACATSLRAADPPEINIEKAFGELAHQDAAVREAARMTLLGLPRSQLDRLRKVVQNSLPLLPSQAASLHDIVTHVYLSGEPYASNERSGFMGVRMNSTYLTLPDMVDRDGRLQSRVVIVDRMPGFVGFRMLRDADVVLGIVNQPALQIRGDQEFAQAVRATPPGQVIELEILRQGQVIHVALKLDPRPDEAGNPLTVGELLRQREEKAAAYWNEVFAPMVDETVS